MAPHGKERWLLFLSFLLCWLACFIHCLFYKMSARSCIAPRRTLGVWYLDKPDGSCQHAVCHPLYAICKL